MGLRTGPFLLLLISLPAGGFAEVYRCGSTYSDTVCGEDAETVPLNTRPLGGDFRVPDGLSDPADDTASSPDSEGEPEPTSDASPCQHIPSTNLRRHLIRDEVVRGMTRDHVRRAFGRPPETYPVPQQTWVYTTDYYGRLYEITRVYFRDGCVERVEYADP
ncbi:hypothetical protein C8D92_10540 [Tamilnaduibacter salinus]|uniref:Uncharacterized protein n=1 Tax=Tamilnaduibacter salinus TaxID=1484056 RepID=A0A2U1CWE1_9GAMM|nr:hypothetical protein [Tamilnaduibacter salinus]PVY76287.1 hypothetical protein C8D92_10540 [Tamilnaduibacter salinus]